MPEPIITADQFREHDDEAVKKYREHIQNIAQNFIREHQSNIIDMSLYQTICMGMSAAYTASMIDNGSMEMSDIASYNEKAREKKSN